MKTLHFDCSPILCNCIVLDIRIIIKSHELSRAKRAGKSVKLADRLGIAVRTAYNYITYTKSGRNTPVTYNSQNKEYR